jgi:hypothetical protein
MTTMSIPPEYLLVGQNEQVIYLVKKRVNTRKALNKRFFLACKPKRQKESS